MLARHLKYISTTDLYRQASTDNPRLFEAHTFHGPNVRARPFPRRAPRARRRRQRRPRRPRRRSVGRTGRAAEEGEYLGPGKVCGSGDQGQVQRRERRLVAIVDFSSIGKSRTVARQCSRSMDHINELMLMVLHDHSYRHTEGLRSAHEPGAG